VSVIDCASLQLHLFLPLLLIIFNFAHDISWPYRVELRGIGRTRHILIIEVLQIILILVFLIGNISSPQSRSLEDHLDLRLRIFRIAEHWIDEDQVDHVHEEHGEDPDDDADHDLDGHDGPGLVLAVAPRAEHVLLVVVEAEDGHHHVVAVAVRRRDRGVDVDPPVGVGGVHLARAQDGLGVRALAATARVHMVLCKTDFNN